MISGLPPRTFDCLIQVEHTVGNSPFAPSTQIKKDEVSFGSPASAQGNWDMIGPLGQF
jgi:hypothetical protein